MCASKDEWIKTMWYMYTMEYYSAIKKEQDNAICSNMDATRVYHSKRSKSEREGHIPCDITYMCNLKYEINDFYFCGGCQGQRGWERVRVGIWG